MTAPPAAGSRVDWEHVPEQGREQIDRACGAAVIEARTAPGGFSPGLAARVGRRRAASPAAGSPSFSSASPTGVPCLSVGLDHPGR